MLADSTHKYGVKIQDSPLYVCTNAPCTYSVRKASPSKRKLTKALPGQSALL